MPLFVFCDDFEYNNALGSHSKSLGGVYVSLPFLPPEYQSTIDNILLALLYKTSYRKEFGDEKVFAPLIAELAKLEKEGIIISSPSGPTRVYFVLGLLLGDNKGLNSLLGFVECFVANYFCRFCKTHRNETHVQCVENKDSLRTEDSYAQDVATNDPSLTGVKYNSALNLVPSFKATSNYCVDTFHDFGEGNCHYGMGQVLKHCVPKYFTIDTLNERIRLFDFGLVESNKVPQLSPNFASKDKFKMSGSETLLFVKLFGVLVGDLVPSNDPYWSLYIKLRQILDICLAKSISVSQVGILKVLVEEFNSMYLSITGDNLKPKMHFWSITL